MTRVVEGGTGARERAQCCGFIQGVAVRSNSIRQARALAAGLALTLVAGLAGLAQSPVHAQSVGLTNTATVTAPSGTNDIAPGNNVDSATVSVSPAASGYSFCTAPGGSATSNAVYSIVNGVQIWRYEAGAGNDAVVPELLLPTVTGAVNALMIDPVNDRLLFHATANSMLWAYDDANGGWYQALSASIPTSDLPRAGMDRNGVGYLVASGGAPAVYRVTANTAGFGYAVQNIGNLQYDFAPTNPGSGDIAFDAAGFGWLAAGQDLYRIDFSAPGNPRAVRQTRPLLGGQPSTVQWAGVAFGDDGRLYVANNSLPSDYYAYDPATGNLSLAAPTGAGGSRDLASCAFPFIAEPELTASKTLAEVNGQPYVDGASVAAGDVLTYAITIGNDGGAVGTLFAGDVGETVPANTTYVAAGNDFACSGATCLNTSAVNIPAGGEATLAFVVRIDDPPPVSVTSIANAVTFPNGAIDCTAPGNDCTETTPLGPLIDVAKRADPADGGAVSAGQTITYTLDVTVGNAATLSDVVLTDTLGAGLSFGTVVDAGDFVVGGSGSVRSFTLPAGTVPGVHSVVYTATVDADAQTSVSNAVVPAGGGDPADPDAPPPDCTACSTTHPLAPVVAVVKSADPASGDAVAAGQTLTYTLNVTVGNAATQSDVVLTDTLGAGLSFGTVVNAGGLVAVGSGSAWTFTLPAGAAPGSYSVVYTATVDADAQTSVSNAVVPAGGGDPADPDAPPPTCTTCTTTHPLAPVVAVAKSADPASGVAVLAGQTLTYTLAVTVANAATQSDVVLTDTLGSGLSFGAVVDAGDFVAGGSGSVRSFTLPAGAAPGSYSVVYTATVDADASTSVANTVVAAGGGDPTDPGAPPPDCGTCTTLHPLASAIHVAKSANPPTGSEVSPGDTIAYTLTVTVANSATTEELTLVDTLGAGLTFGAVTDAGAFTCSGTLTCTLPAGTAPGLHALSYTATVDADATGTLGNVVAASNPPGGNDPDPTCTSCTTEHEVVPTAITVAKAADPAPGSDVLPGDTLTYTLTVTVANSATTEVLTLVDTLGTGLTFAAVTDAGAFACSGALTCTLPAGTLPGSYVVSYTATVDADATGTVRNAVIASNPPGGNDPDPVCTSCETDHPVVATSVEVSKSSDPVSGSEVSPGDTLTYTLTVTVANSATTEVLTLVDTLGTGLTFGAVTDAGAFACSGALTCTLPAGTLPGSYALTYTATVDADATGTVGNTVAASNPPGGNDPDPVCTTCSTEHDVVATSISVVKSADPAPGSEVSPGDTLGYTLTVTVAASATTQVLTLVDALGAGLSFGEVTSAGAFACSGALTCTLPAGTLPGTYAVSYTATVDADATGTLRNAVTASNPAGDPDPECTTCSTEHVVIAPVIAVAKSSDPGSGAEVRAGDVIAYTLTVTIANSATLDTLTLADTLGAGLSFGEVTDAGAFACTGTLTCTLPAGTLPGTYALTYTATVDAAATRIVSNVVVASGGTGSGGAPPTCATCSTEHLLVDPRVLVAKSAAPGDGQEVRVGDTIAYTLTATVENSATLADVRLVDTPGPGLTLGTLPAGCAAQGAGLVCTLPAGTVPGVYTFVYPATVTAEASGQVTNVVFGESDSGEPECGVCETTHELVDDAQLRIVKAVGARNVAIGDLVRYTLTVENVGVLNVTAATVVDTPPTGFSYVEGSMAVADRDGAFTLEGRHPLRIGGLDIDAGGQATIVYLLRVGAGVRAGVHVNEAVAVDASGDPISNVATAQVALDGDPLLDDSLVFGTVFDDRDGDGWQDRADLSEVRVQGGFAPGAYIAGSTTIDRGDGPQPVADASAPLLHGIDVGAIAARQSEGDLVEARRVTIRQRLRAADFSGDFVLTSAQGITVRVDAAGNTTVERSGEAAKGLTAAEPVVERVVSAVEGGVEVAYVISNAGIDERGIPGVRIASVEGLLIETDQYGRYHLPDVHGGDWGRGRNVILKVDPATLPPGTVFTTENPRVRRVTPGIPVRFDFGVQLPVQVLPGGERRVELELGEVVFAPGSAEVREAWLPAIAKMAEQVDAYRGGEVVIVADGDSEALAFARAAAVRDALQARVNTEARAGLRVVLRTRVDDPHSLLAGVDAGGALLGTVLFDTDKSLVRPEFEGLLDAVAQRLEGLGGGVVGIVGHTDVRGSHAYNVALGLRRATAVQQALAQRLSPEVRARVRVEASSDPTAPVGTERE